MIKHIVCFKLKDNSLAECEKAKEVLLSMLIGSLQAPMQKLAATLQSLVDKKNEEAA